MIGNHQLTRFLGQAAAAACAFFLHTATAHAGLVLDNWIVSATASTPNFATGQLSSSSNPNPHTAIATVSEGDSGATAFQSPGGWDLASARVGADLPTDNEVSASAEFSIKVSNNGPDPIPMTFKPVILDGRLEIAMKNFQSAGDFPTAIVLAFFQEDFPNGNHVNFWRFGGILAGPNSSAKPGYTTLLLDPQGIGMPVATVSQDFGAASVDLNTFAGTLDLGQLGSGQTRSFTYGLFALVENGEFFDNTGGSGTAPPPEVTGLAFIEDPFEFGSTFFINDIPLTDFVGDIDEPPVSSVPEPPGWPILAAALAAFALLRRRSSIIPTA